MLFRISFTRVSGPKRSVSSAPGLPDNIHEVIQGSFRSLV